MIRTKDIETIMNGRKSKGMRIDLKSGVWVYTIFDCVNGGMTFNAPKNYLMPIPQTALDRNSKLVQNPGY
jgi:hypothetical protein